MFPLCQLAQSIKPWIPSLPSGENMDRFCGLTNFAMLGVSLYAMDRFKNAVDKDVVHPISFSGNIYRDAAFACFVLSIVSASLTFYAVNCRPFTVKKL